MDTANGLQQRVTITTTMALISNNRYVCMRTHEIHVRACYALWLPCDEEATTQEQHTNERCEVQKGQ